MSEPLRLVRLFDAPTSRVFAAWTRLEDLARWAWGSLGRDVEGEVDLRVGGRYRLTTNRPSGEGWTFSGEFLEVAPDRRLAYTVRWEPVLEYGDVRETLTVEFAERGERTEVTFVHEGVPSDEGRRAHEQGWLNTFDALDEVLLGPVTDTNPG
jgi:uncharacterized protein YndB with AHSA1/START domain